MLFRSIATNDSVPVTGTFWQATQPVSGTVTANQGGTWNINNLSQLGGVAVSMGTGVRDAGTQRVTIATNDSVPVTGTFWQATQPVSGTVTANQGGTWTVQPGNTANTTPWLVRHSDFQSTGILNQLNGFQSVQLWGNSSVGFTVTAVSSPVGIQIQADVSYDGGTTWQNNYGWFTTPTGTRSASLNIGAAGGSWGIVAGAGATHIRVRINSYTSGSITVALYAGNSVAGPELFTTLSGAPYQAPMLAQIGGWDGSNSRSIATDTSGRLNIGSIASALPAGTNAIGKLTANAGVIIGAVELTGATTNTLTTATTTAYANSLVVKASAGVLYSISGYNSKASGQFIQIHDANAVPADTAVPKIIFWVAAQQNFSFDLSVYGRGFANGIIICNSSTGPTKTLGSTDCWFDVLYK